MADTATRAYPAEMAARIAAFGFPAGETEPALPVPRGSWPALRPRLVAERLSGLAVAAAAAGWLQLSEEQLDDLLTLHRDAMIRALALERRLLVLAEAFDAAGIDLVVLKGPSLAHTLYPDASWRPFADLDLLVRTRDWRKACALLGDMGSRRKLPEPRPGFDEQFGKAAVHTDRDGVEIDLHRTLVVGPFGLWMDPDELFSRTSRFSIGGRSLRRLDDTALMLHVCMHAVLGWQDPMLLSVRDVAQVAARGEVDWDELADLAGRWRLRAVLRHAFDTAAQVLGIGWPLEARAALAAEPTREEVRALEAYTTDRRRRGGTAVSTLRAIRGVRAKGAYVRGLLFPAREFLTARSGGEGGSYVRRLKIPFGWLVGRRRG